MACVSTYPGVSRDSETGTSHPIPTTALVLGALVQFRYQFFGSVLTGCPETVNVSRNSTICHFSVGFLHFFLFYLTASCKLKKKVSQEMFKIIKPQQRKVLSKEAKGEKNQAAIVPLYLAESETLRPEEGCP